MQQNQRRTRRNTTQFAIEDEDPRFSIANLTALAEKLENELGLPKPPASSPPVSIFEALVKAGCIEDHADAHKDLRRSEAALLGHARRRKRIRENKEALAALVDPPSPPRRRPGPLPVGQRRYDRVVRVMEPGRWYARGDLMHMAGFGLNTRGEMVRTLLAKALAERLRYSKAGQGPSHNPEPLWLYKLTSKGEALRDALPTCCIALDPDGTKAP
jgi:hypothetical protein